jgi:hypothetical protein
MEEAIPKESIWASLPNSYFLAFFAYALILFVEKVAFDSHSLIHHDHEGHDHGHGHGHDHHDHDSKRDKSIIHF